MAALHLLTAPALPSKPKLLLRATAHRKSHPLPALGNTGASEKSFLIFSRSTTAACHREVWNVPHSHATCRNSRKRDMQLPKAGLEEVSLLWNALKSGSDAIGIYLESAPPWAYLLYLFGAGVGLPFSEDALVIWIASGMIDGRYGNWQQCLPVLLIVYLGVVISDMITFGIGAVLRTGLWSGLREKLLRDATTYERATRMISAWSGFIGAIQRFSLGFRGPLCLVCGFLGVSPVKFLLGTGIAAPLTMGLQLCAGYILKDTSNVYLAALALVALPNLLGHIVGPIMTALGIYYGGRSKKSDSSEESPSPQASG